MRWIAGVVLAAAGAALASRIDAGDTGAASAVRWVTFEGTCDASGAVPIDDRHFAVADDEDNVLRVYDARRGGKPVGKTNLSKRIELPKKGEADIEAATSLGGRAFWLSSHGRKPSGEEDPNRSVVITTALPTVDGEIAGESRVYRNLLRDLLRAPALAPYALDRAAELPPRAPGGLNLEGLTATPEGTLLLGFRNPVPRGKAIVVPLLNPEVLSRPSGSLRLGAPIELDLGGLGVRSLSWWRGSYWIAAGPAGDGGPARLYRWPGPGSAPQLVAESALADANPEAFFTAEANEEMLLLSDDGMRLVDGKPCKRTKGKKNKSFRGVWLRVLQPAA
jgi:hypothetical protein